MTDIHHLVRWGYEFTELWEMPSLYRRLIVDIHNEHIKEQEEKLGKKNGQEEKGLIT